MSLFECFSFLLWIFIYLMLCHGAGWTAFTCWEDFQKRDFIINFLRLYNVTLMQYKGFIYIYIAILHHRLFVQYSLFLHSYSLNWPLDLSGFPHGETQRCPLSGSTPLYHHLCPAASAWHPSVSSLSWRPSSTSHEATNRTQLRPLCMGPLTYPVGPCPLYTTHSLNSVTLPEMKWMTRMVLFHFLYLSTPFSWHGGWWWDLSIWCFMVSWYIYLYWGITHLF